MKVQNSVLSFQSSKAAIASSRDKSGEGNYSFSEIAGGALSPVQEKTESNVQSSSAKTTVDAIRKKYDLRNISYSELKSMSKELMDAGALRESDYLDFLPPSEEFSNLDGTRNKDWDRPMDYIGRLEDQLSFMKSNCPNISTVHLEKMLSMKMKFTHME